MFGTTGLINWEKEIEYQKISDLGLLNRDINCTSPPLGFGLMTGDKKTQMNGVGGKAYICMISFVFETLKSDMILIMASVKHHEVITMPKRLGFNKIHILKNHKELSTGTYDGFILTMAPDECSINKNHLRVLLIRINIKTVK